MKTDRPTAVFLFERSGNTAEPWRKAGYRCITVDIDPEKIKEKPNLERIKMDLSNWSTELDDLLKIKPIFIAAMPPCDHLAVSGARWFKGKGLRKLAESINMFATAAEFCEKSDAPYFIENPVSTISTYWRKPDYYFHPYDYTGLNEDDNYRKKTCLWVGNGFIMPEKQPSVNTIVKDKILNTNIKSTRKYIRSKTAKGFAKAVFRANALRIEDII